MSEGPAFKVPNPRLNPEPNTISYHGLYNYRSAYDLRRAAMLKNFRGALPMFGGILGASLMYVMFLDYSHGRFFGWNGQGGDVLNMRTSNSSYDMAYNREFQRMCYLVQGQEDKVESQTVSSQTLANLGGNETVTANQFVHKKSPHFKYY